MLNQFSFFTKTISTLTFVAIAMVYLPFALAQVSSNEINYFSRCRNLADNNARLSCYDELYDRAVRAVTPHNDAAQLTEENRRMREELARIRERTGSTTTADQATVPRRREPYPETVRRAPYPAAGKTEGLNRNKPQVVVNEDGTEVLYDRIAALKKLPNGWIVTLESGQVWKQNQGRTYRLRVGQNVKLKPTIWGNSYHLSVEELGSFIQVERVK